MGEEGPGLRRPVHRDPARDGLHPVRRRRPRRGGAGSVVEGSAASVDRLFRRESGRSVATLIRVLGDFDLAEDAVQDAWVTALERWPREGPPANPGAWITTVARNSAIDRLRRERVLGEKLAELERIGEVSPDRDDLLRLAFTACHPALAPESRLALTLRTMGGLTTVEIARAFLVTPDTMTRRLSRAKRKIRDAGIPYEVPPPERLAERLGSVLAVLYLVFNEGYAATSADSLIRRELCSEAIHLAAMLEAEMPREPEVAGLLALMLLQDSRRDARVGPGGELVLLADQDRGLWDRGEIKRGLELLPRALGPRRSSGSRPPGPYALQAAIAAEHATAATADDTDWGRIRHLYDWLATIEPTPVIALNRAVAIAMAERPAAGLEAIDLIEGLDGYVQYHLARAELLRQTGAADQARSAYRRALELTENPVQRDFLARRIGELRSAG